MHAKNHPNVMVECENGAKFYTDHVIFTAPLGVLKAKHKSMFSPALPPVRIKYKIDNNTKIQNVCYHILYFTIG
jgi:hypothetical protein